MRNHSRRLGTTGSAAALLATLFFNAGGASAQPAEGGASEPSPEDQPEATAASEAASSTESSAEDSADAPDGDTNEVAPGSGGVEETDDAPADGDEQARAPNATENAAEIARLRTELAELRAQQEEAQARALSENVDEEVRRDILSIYGFMDMGVQRAWVDDRAVTAALFHTNATTFAVGNIDFYFDANPHPDWRGLAEIRFTGAPHGRIETYGGPFTDGDFERANTQQYDPHGTAINAPMWGGYTVIERAWVEWKRYQSLKIRTGSFFTPFGIWNVDHGLPTLISTAMPQFIQQGFFPLRQVGVQALGSAFINDIEFAYRVWLSNGRQELANLDFTDDKAFGARTFLRHEKGTVRYQVGASFHHGRVADRQVDITGVPSPLNDTTAIEFRSFENWAYHESIGGLDLSLDLNKTRIRVEGTAQLRKWVDGKEQEIGIQVPVPGSVAADSWRYAGYVIVAQELPFWGLEPYLYGELIQQQWELPNGFAMFAPGLNIRFTPSAMLKLQAARAVFFDWDEESIGEASLNNVTTALARVVLAF